MDDFIRHPDRPEVLPRHKKYFCSPLDRCYHQGYTCDIAGDSPSQNRRQTTLLKDSEPCNLEIPNMKTLQPELKAARDFYCPFSGGLEGRNGSQDFLRLIRKTGSATTSLFSHSPTSPPRPNLCNPRPMGRPTPKVPKTAGPSSLQHQNASTFKSNAGGEI